MKLGGEGVSEGRRWGSGVMAGCEAGFYDGVLKPVKNKQIWAREGGNIPRKKLMRLKGKKILWD